MAYKLTHSETGDQIEVGASYVEMYESQGWQKSPKARDPKPVDQVHTEAEIAAAKKSAK